MHINARINADNFLADLLGPYLGSRIVRDKNRRLRPRFLGQLCRRHRNNVSLFVPRNCNIPRTRKNLIVRPAGDPSCLQRLFGRRNHDLRAQQRSHRTVGDFHPNLFPPLDDRRVILSLALRIPLKLHVLRHARRDQQLLAHRSRGVGRVPLAHLHIARKINRDIIGALPRFARGREPDGRGIGFERPIPHRHAHAAREEHALLLIGAPHAGVRRRKTHRHLNGAGRLQRRMHCRNNPRFDNVRGAQHDRPAAHRQGRRRHAPPHHCSSIHGADHTPGQPACQPFRRMPSGTGLRPCAMDLRFSPTSPEFAYLPVQRPLQ